MAQHTHQRTIATKAIHKPHYNSSATLTSHLNLTNSSPVYSLWAHKHKRHSAPSTFCCPPTTTSPKTQPTMAARQLGTTNPAAPRSQTNTTHSTLPRLMQVSRGEPYYWHLGSGATSKTEASLHPLTPVAVPVGLTAMPKPVLSAPSRSCGPRMISGHHKALWGTTR